MRKKHISLKNKIFNNLMVNGNKRTCEKILLKNLKVLQKQYNKNHITILKLAIINSAPVIKLKQIKKKKRKSLKEFPFVLNQKNRISLGIKHIIEKINKTRSEKLSQEIVLFANKSNEFLKNKETKQKIALTKKKYIFFRWFY